MIRVNIESPLRGNYQRNRAYARAACRDAIKRGENPYASHLFFDQRGILDDTIPEERQLGMLMGQQWAEQSEVTVLYIDYGVSSGMRDGLLALPIGRAYSVRTLEVPEGVFKLEPTRAHVRIGAQEYRGPLIGECDIEALDLYLLEYFG